MESNEVRWKRRDCLPCIMCRSQNRFLQCESPKLTWIMFLLHLFWRFLKHNIMKRLAWFRLKCMLARNKTYGGPLLLPEAQVQLSAHCYNCFTTYKVRMEGQSMTNGSFKLFFQLWKFPSVFQARFGTECKHWNLAQDWMRKKLWSSICESTNWIYKTLCL